MKTSLIAFGAALFLSGQALAASGNILPLTTKPVVASTVPADGDVNPYGVAFVPQGFPAIAGGLVPGDILVSNFNNNQNLQGTGTTIVKVSANGSTSLFYQGLPDLGLSTALGILKEGFVLVGNLPTVDGTSATAHPGSLMILGPTGQVIETLGLPMINGPWDMTLYENGNKAVAFVASAIDGSITRLDFVLGEAPLGIDLVSQTVIATGFKHQGDPAALFDAPTGMVYDPFADFLYVASTDDNAVYAVHHAGTRIDASAKGHPIYSDPVHLHGALAMTLAPNGHLLVTNNDVINSDPNHPSEIVEFTTAGKFVAETPVDPAQGGSFGLSIQATGPHKARLAAVDDNTATLKIWNVAY